MQKNRQPTTIAGSYGASPAIVDLSNYNPDYTFAVFPGSGNISKVQISFTNGAANNPNSANWFDWPNGSVSSASYLSFGSPVQAVRFVRVSGSASDTYEVCL